MSAKAGNPRLRTTLIQLAWLWLRISRNRRWLCGSRTGSAAMAAVSRRRPSWRWLWLRNQPQSALALWFKDRGCRNGGRLKKTTIVALARKLLVVLWKYVTAGVVIDGAIVKSA